MAAADKFDGQPISMVLGLKLKIDRNNCTKKAATGELTVYKDKSNGESFNPITSAKPSDAGKLVPPQGREAPFQFLPKRLAGGVLTIRYVANFVITNTSCGFSRVFGELVTVPK
jgi:hypothetical protein